MTATTPKLRQQDVASALGPSAAYLGSGTFGETWRCGDRAFKILCGAPQEPGRIHREVEALRRVNHPNVVRMHGLHEVTVGSDKYQVLEFDYVPGGDIQNLLDANIWPTASEVYDLALGLLSGLHALHESGTIHRDLKPANVAVRHGMWSDPVILDLGLAKPLDATTFTVYPGLIGTPLYMAPEQLQGIRATKSSDLFAVGVILYVAIMRVHPFCSPNELLDITTFLDRQSRFSVSLPGDTHRGLRNIMDRLLSYAPHRRGSTTSNLRRLTG